MQVCSAAWAALDTGAGNRTSSVALHLHLSESKGKFITWVLLQNQSYNLAIYSFIFALSFNGENLLIRKIIHF